MVMPVNSQNSLTEWNRSNHARQRPPVCSVIDIMRQSGMPVPKDLSHGASLASIIATGVCNENFLVELIANYYSLPIFSTKNQLRIKKTSLQLVDHDRMLLIVTLDSKAQIILIDDPKDLFAAQSYALAARREIDIYFTNPNYHKQLSQAVTTIPEAFAPTTSQKINIPLLAKQLLNKCKDYNASDLHLTPQPSCYQLAYRIDGMIQPITLFSIQTGNGLINHWKIRAELDITEQQRPQEGTIFTEKKSMGNSFRLSVCPTIHGEKMVLRRHLDASCIMSIDSLGTTTEQQRLLCEAITQPQGLILITGPTGSGKTQTLYTLLREISKQSRQIITIEDPVEISVPELTQINVGPELSYTEALKAVLRQDPDVILIGEIRDQQTAAVALAAAQTGHLVLASLHTNGCFATWQRLLHLGLSANDLVDCVELVVAQRLLRKTVSSTNPAATSAPNDICYHGRVGIFEMLQLNNKWQEILPKIKKITEWQSAAKELGWQSLTDAAWKFIESGVTDWAEAQRVLGWHAIADLAAILPEPA